MKYSKILIILSLFTFPSVNYAAFILEGDSERYDFSPLDFTENPDPIFSYNNVQFGFSFSNSLFAGGFGNPVTYNGNLEVGESLKVEFFENQGDSIPFETHILNGTNPEASGYIYSWGDFLNIGGVFMPWLDFEGSIKFTSLSGEVELITPGIIVSQNGFESNANLSVSAVPLPPSLLLFLSSLVPLFLFRRKK